MKRISREVDDMFKKIGYKRLPIRCNPNRIIYERRYKYDSDYDTAIHLFLDSMEFEHYYLNSKWNVRIFKNEIECIVVYFKWKGWMK